MTLPEKLKEAQAEIVRLRMVVIAADGMRNWFHHVTVRGYDKARGQITLPDSALGETK